MMTKEQMRKMELQDPHFAEMRDIHGCINLCISIALMLVLLGMIYMYS